MSTRHGITARVKADGLIAIVRGDFAVERTLAIADTVRDAGVSILEVTLNTTGALEAIAALRLRQGERMLIGAGTVRGLHYQAPPCAQAKLVRVVQGRILDIAVDIRRSSPTFGQWVAAEISAADGSEIFVPVGFAHGICTLEPDTAVLYKVSDYYSPAHDLGIRWNDPAIGVTWPIGEADAILSDKDRSLPFMRDADLF